MSKLNWFWPFSTEKECWLEAMGLVYDDEYESIEILVAYFHNGSFIDSSWCNGEDYRPLTCVQEKIRPIHKYRWLAEKYEKGQHWKMQYRHSSIKDITEYEPDWFEDYTYWPSQEHEPELYKWYLQEKDKHEN